MASCEACGAATVPQTFAIQVEWDDGSDLLGDFVHAGAKIVTRRTIGETLQTRFGGITLGEVAMPDHPNLRRPKRVTKRTPRRIWLPYEGPELCYLDPVDVDLDPSSTIEIDKHCQECGTIRYRKLNGVEVKTPATPASGKATSSGGRWSSLGKTDSPVGTASYP